MSRRFLHVLPRCGFDQDMQRCVDNEFGVVVFPKVIVLTLFKLIVAFRFVGLSVWLIACFVCFLEGLIGGQYGPFSASCKAHRCKRAQLQQARFLDVDANRPEPEDPLLPRARVNPRS